MMRTTRTTRRAVGLLLGLGFAGSAPVLAQPPTAGSASTEPSSAWTLDAGISRIPGLRFGWGSESSTVGAWIGVGSGNLRLNVDYWHAEEHRGPGMYDPGLFETGIEDQIDVAGVWRFRTGRALSPYVLAGGGFSRFRYHSCWDTSIGRLATGHS